MKNFVSSLNRSGKIAVISLSMLINSSYSSKADSPADIGIKAAYDSFWSDNFYVNSFLHVTNGANIDYTAYQSRQRAEQTGFPLTDVNGLLARDEPAYTQQEIDGMDEDLVGHLLTGPVDEPTAFSLTTDFIRMHIPTTGIPDPNGNPLQHTTWGKIKNFYK